MFRTNHGLTINERYRMQLYGGEQRSNLENPSSWFIEWATGGASASGVPVNDETALTYAAIYACNRVLADSIASLPIGLYRQEPDGDISPATERAEHRLISRNPGGDSMLYTSEVFRSTLQFHLGLRGNAYARIFRDGRGGAKALRILHPNFVKPFFHEGRLFYEVTPNPSMGESGGRDILAPDQILHIAALSTDGIIGRSPISLLKDTIGIGLGNRDYVARLQKRGGRVDGFLKHPSKLTQEQVGGVRENFKSAMQRGEVPLLENGLDYQAVSLTPTDAEFVNTHKLTMRDIAAVYRVPLHMIGDLERATFSNIEHQSLEFVKHTLLPWIKNWEAELNRKLLPYNLQDNYYFKFNVEGLLRGDIKTRMEAYTKAIQWGIMNRDEVRALEERNRIPDGLGQTFLTPLNMVELGKEDDNQGEADTDVQQNPQNEQDQ